MAAADADRLHERILVRGLKVEGDLNVYGAVSLKRAMRLADVRDEPQMAAVFGRYRPQLVFHAAALKHVPIVEEHPGEGVLTNVAGSRVVADLCLANNVDAMVVCPCSMGAMSAIAHGASNNLLERAADVMLKERKKLILVPRETPYSDIHLENMLKLSRMDAVIVDANPGFYNQPKTIDDLIDFVVAKVLDQLQVEHDLQPKWGE